MGTTTDVCISDDYEYVMDNSCFDTNQFENVDGLNPYPWLQYRHVASKFALSREQSFGPREGSKNIVVHEVDFTWRNDSPIQQYVYALMSRSPVTIVGTGRGDQYLQILGGQTVGAFPPKPGRTMSDTLYGGGFDAGAIGSQAAFSVWEERYPGNTTLFGETMVINPGEMWRGWAEVHYVNENTDTAAINGGNGETEMRYSSGATQLDVYAYPKLN